MGDGVGGGWEESQMWWFMLEILEEKDTGRSLGITGQPDEANPQISD